MEPSNSPANSINWTDIKNTAQHLLIAAILSFILYIADIVIPQMHFTGNWALLLPIVSALADIIRRFRKNYQV